MNDSIDSTQNLRVRDFDAQSKVHQPKVFDHTFHSSQKDYKNRPSQQQLLREPPKFNAYGLKPNAAPYKERRIDPSKVLAPAGRPNVISQDSSQAMTGDSLIKQNIKGSKDTVDQITQNQQSPQYNQIQSFKQQNGQPVIKKTQKIRYTAILDGKKDEYDCQIVLEADELQDLKAKRNQDLRQGLVSKIYQDYFGDDQSKNLTSLKILMDGVLEEFKGQFTTETFLVEGVKFHARFQTAESKAIPSKYQEQASNIDLKLQDNLEETKKSVSEVMQEFGKEIKQVNSKILHILEQIQFTQNMNDPSLEIDQKTKFLHQKKDISWGKIYKGVNLRRQRTEIREKAGALFKSLPRKILDDPDEPDPTKSHFHEDKELPVDLFYLYADPLVQLQANKTEKPVSVPLDLEVEFNNLIFSLDSIGKQFKIQREAFSNDMLTDIIDKIKSQQDECTYRDDSAILHISSHGAFDKRKNQFYLAIEDTKNFNNNKNIGQEGKLFEKVLKDVLNERGKNIVKDQKNKYFKMAFISACQSADIGRIFINSGLVPVVIAVDSNQEIMDEVCKLFSQYFYRSLIGGKSIQESFDSAKLSVRTNDEKGQFNICCCSHDHDEDCTWFKIFKKNPKLACDLHNSKRCKCENKDKREHKDGCSDLIYFKTELEKAQKKEEKKLNKIPNNSSNVSTKLASLVDYDSDVMLDDMSDSDTEKQKSPENALQKQKTQRLQNKIDEMIDDDSDVIQSDEEEEVKPFKDIGHNDESKKKKHDNHMCCCRKDQIHDETMKFKIIYDKDKLTNQQITELLHKPIFNKKSGKLVNADQEIQRRMHFSKVNKQLVYGREMEIYKVVKFISDKSSSAKRVRFIKGSFESGCKVIGKQAITYTINRHLYNDGAYSINLQNFNEDQIIQSIINNVVPLATDFNQMIEELRQKWILIQFNILDMMDAQDTEQLLTTLQKIIESTDNLKIMCAIENDDHLEKDMLPDDFDLMEIGAMEAKDAMQLMFDINKNHLEFQKKYVVFEKGSIQPEFKNHRIFKEIFWTPQIVKNVSEEKIQQGIFLDDIYKQMIADQNKKIEKQTGEMVKKKMKMQEINHQHNIEKVNEVMYDLLKSQHSDELNIMKILSMAPSGLTLFDLVRITSPNFSCGGLKFGKWDDFLLNFFSSEKLAKSDTLQSNQSNYRFGQGIDRSNSMWLRKQDSKQIRQKIFDSQQTDLSSKIKDFQLKYNISIIKKNKVANTEMEYFYLQKPFSEFIKSKMNPKEMQNCAIHYIKYMSILSRQLLRSIAQQPHIEINQYAVSQQLGEGIWREPSIYRNQLQFRKDEKYYEYRKDMSISRSDKLYYHHERNFFKIFKIERMGLAQEVFINNQSEEGDFINLPEFVSELLVTIPSILLMLKRYSLLDERINEFKKLIDTGIASQIFQNEAKQVIKAKLLMIECSYNIEKGSNMELLSSSSRDQQVIKEDIDRAEQILTDLKGESHADADQGLYEVKFLRALLEIKAFEIDYSREESHTKKIDESRTPKAGKSVAFEDFEFGEEETCNKNDKISEIIELLEQSRTHVVSDRKSKMYQFKTWVLQADFITTSVTQIDKSLIRDLSQEHRQSLDEIYQSIVGSWKEQSIKSMIKNNYEVLHAHSFLYLAKIQYLFKNFTTAWNHAQICIKNSDRLNLVKLNQIAEGVLAQISGELGQNVEQNFVFAKSLPLDFQTDENLKDFNVTNIAPNKVIYSDLQDETELIIEALKESQKAINVKFDLLNEQFLADLSKNGCKVLHLTPFMVSINNEEYITIEDNNQFASVSVTPEQLRSMLMLNQKSKISDISLVIIELPNCSNFSNMFIDLGVTNVLTFDTPDPLAEELISSSDSEFEEVGMTQYHQNFINQVKSYMRAFCLNFYKTIGHSKSQKLTDHLRKCDQATREMFRENTLISDMKYVLSSDSQREAQALRMDGSQSLSLKNGLVCDISLTRCNFDYCSSLSPFITRDKQILKKLCLSLSFLETKVISDSQPILKKKSVKNFDSKFASHQQKYLNIWGTKGVGKTRLVTQAAHYLRYRYMFGEGILYIDLNDNKLEDPLNELHVAINRKKQIEMTKNIKSKLISELQKKRKNLKKTQSTSESPGEALALFMKSKPKNDNKDDTATEQRQAISKDSMLLIFDNCDEYLDRNPIEFKQKLRFMKKEYSQICVVLISENKLFLDFISQENQIYVPPFDIDCSFIFLKTLSCNLIQQKVLSERKNPKYSNYWDANTDDYQDLVKMSHGNSQLLSILTLLYSFGGKKLMKKVELKSTDILEKRMLNLQREKSISSPTSPSDKQFKFRRDHTKHSFKSALESLEQLEIEHQAEDNAFFQKYIKKHSFEEMSESDNNVEYECREPDTQEPFQFSRSKTSKFKRRHSKRRNIVDQEKIKMSKQKNKEDKKASKEEKKSMQNQEEDSLESLKEKSKKRRTSYKNAKLSSQESFREIMNTSLRMERRMSGKVTVGMNSQASSEQKSTVDSGIEISKQAADNLITHYQGFFIESQDTSGQKLKVFLDTMTQYLYIFGQDIYSQPKNQKGQARNLLVSKPTKRKSQKYEQQRTQSIDKGRRRSSVANADTLQLFQIEKLQLKAQRQKSQRIEKKVMLKLVDSQKQVESITIFYPCKIDQKVHSIAETPDEFSPINATRPNLFAALTNQSQITEEDDESSQRLSTHRSKENKHRNSRETQVENMSSHSSYQSSQSSESEQEKFPHFKKRATIVEPNDSSYSPQSQSS